MVQTTNSDLFETSNKSQHETKVITSYDYSKNFGLVLPFKKSVDWVVLGGALTACLPTLRESSPFSRQCLLFK